MAWKIDFFFKISLKKYNQKMKDFSKSEKLSLDIYRAFINVTRKFSWD